MFILFFYLDKDILLLPNYNCYFTYFCIALYSRVNNCHIDIYIKSKISFKDPSV